MKATTKRILSALATLDEGKALGLPFDAELYGTRLEAVGHHIDLRQSSGLPAEANLPTLDWMASQAASQYAPAAGRAAVISAFDDLLEEAAQQYLEPLADRREKS